MTGRKHTTTIEIVTDEAAHERFIDALAREAQNAFPPPVAFTWPSGVTVQYTPALKWTKERPTRDGWYWVRGLSLLDGGPGIARVTLLYPDGAVMNHAQVGMRDYSLDEIEWFAGPIPFPEPIDG